MCRNKIHKYTKEHKKQRQFSIEVKKYGEQIGLNRYGQTLNKRWPKVFSLIARSNCVFNYFKETLMQMHNSISENPKGSVLMIFYQEHLVETMQIGK